MLLTGSMASCRHSNDSNDTKSRDYEKSSRQHTAYRTQNMATEAERHTRIGPWLLHVSNQYGSNEKPNWIFGRSRYVYSDFYLAITKY